jgi:hypothetical protein
VRGRAQLNRSGSYFMGRHRRVWEKQEQLKYRHGLRDVVFVVLMLAVSATSANSQLTYQGTQNVALKPRWVPPKPDKIVLDPHQAIAGAFVLKFVEGSHVRPGPNGLSLDPQAVAKDQSELKRLTRAGLSPETAAAQLAQFQKLLSDYGAKYGFKVDPLFQGQGNNAQGESQFSRKSQLERQAGEELADLDLYYVVHAPNFKEIAVQTELMNQLNSLAIVEQVHPDVPSSGAQATPDVSSGQGYLDAAPSGLDGRYIWTRPGGRGENIRFIDVEYDWVTDHEDFPSAANLTYGGRPACPYVFSESEHGTAVMGVIAAPDNGIGVTGFAPNLHYGLSSVCLPADYAGGFFVALFSGEDVRGRTHAFAVAQAINIAAYQLLPGDVMLIEQHTPGPGTGMPCTCNCEQWEYVPMEYYQESFDAIRLATAAGIIVVEAGANGGQNLDGSLYQERFNRIVRDSHALLVGAAGAGDGRVACFSSSSRRMDLYAWGGGVTTLGYGDGTSPPFNNPTVTRHYTQTFSGTSSASALVAGSVVSLQSARVGAGLPRLAPDEMRNLLVATGTPQQDSPDVFNARPIGVQPDLRNAFQRSVLPASAGTETLVGLNLPGRDIPPATTTANDDGTQCSVMCLGGPLCRAWSWVRPGVQGASAMCWQKASPPAATNDVNTASGSQVVRGGQNLPGGDYRSFATANDGGGQCLATCLRDAACRTWSWVRPGVQGPAPMCWMKNTVPSFIPDANTTSGVVRPPDPVLERTANIPSSALATPPPWNQAPGGSTMLVPDQAFAGGTLTGVVLGPDDQPVANTPVQIAEGGIPGDLGGEVIGDEPPEKKSEAQPTPGGTKPDTQKPVSTIAAGKKMPPFVKCAASGAVNSAQQAGAQAMSLTSAPTVVRTDALGRFALCVSPQTTKVSVNLPPQTGETKTNPVLIPTMSKAAEPVPQPPLPKPPEFLQPGQKFTLSGLFPKAGFEQNGKQGYVPVATATTHDDWEAISTFKAPRSLQPGAVNWKLTDRAGKQTSFSSGIFEIVRASLDRSQLHSNQGADFEYEVLVSPQTIPNGLCVEMNWTGPITMLQSPPAKVPVDASGHGKFGGKIRATQIAPGSSIPFDINAKFHSCGNK